MLQSGQHSEAYYRELWTTLKRTGQWQGEIWNRRKNGEIYPERLTISTHVDQSGELLHYIALAADISRQKKTEEVMWQQANHDPLTGLPNRRLLIEHLSNCMTRAGDTGKPLALMHINLDHFGEVNNTLGHSFGDHIIMAAGRRISACVDEDIDMVAHIGGDEFVVLLASEHSARAAASDSARTIIRALSQPYSLGKEFVYITASIGIGGYPADATSSSELLANADQAMVAAKTAGGNRYRHFSASLKTAAQLRMQLANDLRSALVANQLELYYQPIYCLKTGAIVKAEALLRWHHPERGMVSPQVFIPIAEEIGLISEIGDWVVMEAADMTKRWSALRSSVLASLSDAAAPTAERDTPEHIQITVNKSPRQFFTGNTERTWIDYFEANDIDPRLITIEITEGLILEHRPEVLQKLNAFRDAGMKIALDDFGTGYSSMSYLKKFPIDYIKIDRSFIRDIATSASDRTIAEAIIAMSHKLGIKVVAEGVESTEQRFILAESGCDFGQGYFFSRALPAREFERAIFHSIHGIATGGVNLDSTVKIPALRLVSAFPDAESGEPGQAGIGG
jgi:diguanylate cyclase (GGDEF)-like protein